MAGTLAWMMFIIELVSFPKARALLRIHSARQWLGNIRVFVDFVRGRYPEHHIVRKSEERQY